MEGYLNLWIDIFLGWQPRYIRHSEEILEIFEENDGGRIAQMSLKITTFRSIPEDRLRIVINSGTTELQLRAPTLIEKQKWLKSFEDAKKVLDEQAHSRFSVKSLVDHRNSAGNILSKKFLTESPTIELEKKLTELRTKQANFDKTAQLLEPEMKNNPQLASLVEKLITCGKELGESVTECAQDFELSNKRFSVLISEANDFRSSHVDSTATKQPKRCVNSGEVQYISEDETPYHSFTEDDNEEEDKNYENENIILNGVNGNISKEDKVRSRNISHNEENNRQNSFVLRLHPTRDVEKKLHPVIRYLLEKNEAFKGIKLDEDIERSTLPHLVDPNQKLPIEKLLKILKDCVGKDISRFSMPVWVNEPIGMLQKLCENLEYYQLLNKANQIQDPCLRLAYVCLYAVSCYSTAIGRNKKPFNPLLGETFEYQAPDGGLRFIAEQVSHHPPISAGYADGPGFKLWFNSDGQVNFTGNSIEVNPISHIHVVLNRHSDHIIYRRAQMAITNLIFGTRYIENYGDMAFKNLKTGDTASLHLKKRGWGGRGAHELEGTVSDANGKIRYKIQGKWDSLVTVTDAATGAEVDKWQRHPLISNHERMHNFTRFVLQLNHLTPSMLESIAPTDTRLRPDQRLLEMGNIEVANREKNRLEEKQREVRKLMEKCGKIHKPRWFEETVDPVVKEKSYQYLGGYWEARKKDAFSDLPDLYSEAVAEIV